MDLIDELARSGDPDRVLIRLTPAIMRRGVGVGAIAVLGAMLVWLAFSTSPGLGSQLMMIALGVGALVFATYMWRVSATVLELTTTELRQADGCQLCAVDDVVKVERGAFAFKPSNGFLIHTASPQVRAYVPGIWWRFGRRIGVGGLTNAGQAKAVAELMTALVRERDERG